MKVTQAILLLALIGSGTAHAALTTGELEQGKMNCQAAFDSKTVQLSPDQVDAQWKLINGNTGKVQPKAQSASAAKTAK